MDPEEIKVEWLTCSADPAYFAEKYIFIFNATLREWIPFRMWPAQRKALSDIQANQYVIMLKARQLGMTWLCLTYALWVMIFHPAPNVMIMSKRDEEAVDLLTNRLIEMYNRLPTWMQAKTIKAKSAHDFILSNGSRAKAFPTSGGRSYTGTLVLLDEADFLPDLNGVLNSVRPTIDAGGQLIMISTVDKEKPGSPFKGIFRTTWYQRKGQYHPIFFPWQARPGRTRRWYNAIKEDMYQQQGSDDAVFQEYPETVEQALAPLELDKRIPFRWLAKVQQPLDPIEAKGIPGVPGLKVYKLPQPGRHYIIGADPAEGNPTSDDSAGCVLEDLTWEEVATFAGKWEPKVFGGYIDQVSEYFNGAPCMPERNNHGHALILAMQEAGRTLVLKGHSDEKAGWLDNSKGKTLMYDLVAETVRDQGTIIHDGMTLDQLASIEAETLRAPEGMHDDHADALALAMAGLKYRYISGAESTMVPAQDIIEQYDKSKGW
jgi:hypothetical protein